MRRLHKEEITFEMMAEFSYSGRFINLLNLWSKFYN